MIKNDEDYLIRRTYTNYGGRKMCEYCEKGKIHKSCNFCGSAKMRISCSKEFNILEVQGDKEKFSLFKRQYCPRFDINYCPMCGRKLGE